MASENQGRLRTRGVPISKRYGCDPRLQPVAGLQPPEVRVPLPGQALVRAARRDDGRDGPQQDRDVQPDRPVLEVIEVEPDEIVEAEVGAAGDLPETRHPREHEVALTVPGLEQLVVADGE